MSKITNAENRKKKRRKEEEEKPELCFKNYNRLMKVPFAVYADFEAFLEDMDSCEPDKRKFH